MEALYRKVAGEVAKFLGRGLDLTWSVPPEGHTSALLTMAILKDMTWSRIQPPVRVFCANTVSKCLRHIFTSTGQSGSQHPPVEAATDDHDRFGSSFEDPDPRPIITRC